MKKIFYLLSICSLLAACSYSATASPPGDAIEIVSTNSFNYEVAPIEVATPYVLSSVVSFEITSLTAGQEAVICCNTPGALTPSALTLTIESCCNGPDLPSTSLNFTGESALKPIKRIIEDCCNGPDILSAGDNYSLSRYNLNYLYPYTIVEVLRC